MSTTHWRQFAPFYFYTAAVLLLTTTAAATGNSPSKSAILVLAIVGFLSWGLVEYVLHRFIFHFDARSVWGRRITYATHISHHENPKTTNNLFASMKISVPIAAAYWLLAWATLGTWRAASFLFAGLIGGYFSYEWFHFQAHQRRSRVPLFRYLKKYHLLHHYRTPGLRFGVTSPLFDFVFGTFRPVGDTGKVKAQQ